MNTVLIWTTLNTGTYTTTIYRGTAPLDRANLSNPVATLTGGETTWTDTNTVRGQQYYYVFVTTNTTDRVVSPNVAVKAVPRRGPGPNDLQYGDYNYGYFGKLTTTEFIAPIELKNTFNLPVASTVTQQAPAWHKFARNGKTLFVPNGAIVSGVSWKQFYDLGLVFGVTGPGPYNAGANVDQKKTIKIGGDTFIVRLLKSYSDDLALFPGAAEKGTIAEPAEYVNEWNDLIYPLSVWCPLGQRLVNVDSTLPTFPTNIITMQRFSAAANSTPILRGAAAQTRAGIGQRTGEGLVLITTAGGWVPVLELVESTL